MSIHKFHQIPTHLRVQKTQKVLVDGSIPRFPKAFPDEIWVVKARIMPFAAWVQQLLCFHMRPTCGPAVALAWHAIFQKMGKTQSS